VRGLLAACSAVPDKPASVGRLDPDTTVSHHSGLAALKAAGAVCTAVDRILARKVRPRVACVWACSACFLCVGGVRVSVCAMGMGGGDGPGWGTVCVCVCVGVCAWPVKVGCSMQHVALSN